MRDGHDLDVVANADKDFHSGFKRGRLVAVHFHIQPPETALRSRIGPLGILAKPEKRAEPPRVRAALVILRFKHEPSNPLFPLPRPSEGRLATASDITAGVQQRK